jgi:hypothetical protein
MRWWPLSGPQPFCSQPKSKLQYLHHTLSQTIIGNQTVCGIFECNGSSNMTFNIWSQPWCCRVLQIQHFPLCSFNLFFQALLQLSVFIFKLEFSSTVVETISSKYLFRQMTKVSQFRWPIHLEMEQLWNAWLYTLINISFVRWDTFKPSSLSNVYD